MDLQGGEEAGRQLFDLVENALRFAFRCHQFAGGFDGETTQLFVALKSVLEPAEAQAACS